MQFEWPDDAYRNRSYVLGCIPSQVSSHRGIFINQERILKSLGTSVSESSSASVIEIPLIERLADITFFGCSTEAV